MADMNSKEILDAIQTLTDHMDERFKQAEELNQLRFTQLEKMLEERMADARKDMTLQFSALNKRIDLAESQLGQRIDLVEQHLSQRIDLVNERVDKLYIAVDSFIALHKKLDQEFGMLQAKYDRLGARLSRIEARFAI